MAQAQAVNTPVLDFSFNADADCSSGASGPGPNGSFQYCIVKATANDMACAPSSSAGATILAKSPSLGVLQTAPSASQAATVRMLGITKLVVDGSGTAITPGAWLTNDTSGRGVVISAPSSSAAAVAMALQGSAAANDIISAFVLPQYQS